MKKSQILKQNYVCKIWGFHGGDYDDYHLLGDDNHQNYVLFHSFTNDLWVCFCDK
jgi:hypothetical protein